MTLQMPYQNPHATKPLYMPVLVICNTPDEEIERNIRVNSERSLPWVGMHPKHDQVAIMCGGGPSLVSYLYDILRWQEQGAVIFAMNGASQFLRNYGIVVDYQVIADAKPETASLVDPGASHHLIASQCDPSTVDATARTTLWHLTTEDAMERLFPQERVKAGGYALIGGGVSVGNSALCVAYALGYRTFEIYGYDSSHRGDASHAYEQHMNKFLPTVDVEWGGKTYKSSLAMKIQAERFQMTANSLIKEGCTLNVHGDGLLPAMWNSKPEALTEKDKYRLMYASESYREESPGERQVPLIMELLKPEGKIIDFGCGTGRAGVALAKHGLSPFLIDFADNCRDEEAVSLPFLEWDMTQPIPQTAKFGMCCDVMEHIPPDDVAVVIENIMASAEQVFFMISTIQDMWGEMIGCELHLTVKPHAWWKAMFDKYQVTFEQDAGIASLFIVKRYAA
jgi:Protein of unknown function DUF115